MKIGNKKTRNKKMKNKKTRNKKIKKIKYNNTKKQGGTTNYYDTFSGLRKDLKLQHQGEINIGNLQEKTTYGNTSSDEGNRKIIEQLATKLQPEIEQQKKDSLTSQIGDAISKTKSELSKKKDEYSITNLKKRRDEWFEELEEAKEIEKARRAADTTTTKDKIENMGSKAFDMGSKAFGSVKKNAIPFGKGASNFINNGLNSIGNQVISDEHKELIKIELEKLKTGNKLTEKEFKHAMEQIGRRDGVLGIKDSFMSLLAPVQEMVKVVGDWVFNTGDTDFPSKQTHVKLLWVPKMYKHYVKGKIPDKNQKPDLEVDDFMVIIKETHDSHIEKINSDMNGVDSLLANTLNGCIGPGCKEGIVSPPILMEKDINITDNIRRKEVLNQWKEQKQKELDSANKLKEKPDAKLGEAAKKPEEPGEVAKLGEEPGVKPGVKPEGKSEAKQDHYKTLGILNTATKEEITKAYKKMAKTWHPDKNLDKTEEAQARFQEISSAYNILKDPEKKKQYDLQ